MKVDTLIGRRELNLSLIFSGKRLNVYLRASSTTLFAKDGPRHPEILKTYLRGEVSIETMVILDKILGFRQDFDKHLSDPVWETVSMRIKKYSSFLHIDVFRYKKILKEIVLGSVK